MRANFKDILAEFLKENELTQTEFANKIGVKQGQVSEWLNGKCKPGYDILRQMALAFDVTADFLLGIQERD